MGKPVKSFEAAHRDVATCFLASRGASGRAAIAGKQPALESGFQGAFRTASLYPSYERDGGVGSDRAVVEESTEQPCPHAANVRRGSFKLTAVSRLSSA